MLEYNNAELAAALQPGQERHIRAVVEVDWLKDGSFTGWGSGLSDELISVEMEDEVDAGLPDEVNGSVSAASTALTVRAAGDRTLTIGGQAVPLWRIFSPFEPELPYWKMDLSGAAIRYILRVQTANGPVDVRQFTGWVRSVETDRTTGEVIIQAANHLHIQGKRISLPRWARWVAAEEPQLPDIGSWNIPTEDRMENAPISFAWIWQYILRKCNATEGPDFRPGAIWFSSGFGGMIPELASWSDYQAGRSFQNQGVNRYQWPGVWTDFQASQGRRQVNVWGGLNFFAPICTNLQDDTIFQSYSQAGATVQLRPGPDQPRYLNGGAWTYRSNTGSGTSFLKLDVYLDSWQYVLGEYTAPLPGGEPDMASVRFRVDNTGTTLRIRSTGANAPYCEIKTTNLVSAVDFVYVSYEVDWQNPANSRIFYNNVAQPVTVTGTLTTYPTYLGDFGFGADKSKVRVWQRSAPYVNAEVWQATSATTTRIATWANDWYARKDFAIVNGGLAGSPTVQPVDIASSLIDGTTLPAAIPAATHLPVREDVDAWELLKETVHAAGATMFIDAYGGLRIIPQVVMEQIENRIEHPKWVLTADHGKGFTVRAGFDQIRTAISYGGSPHRAVKDVAFEASSAKQFWAPGQGTAVYLVSAGDDVIQVEPGDVERWASTVPQDDWGLEGFCAVSTFGVSVPMENPHNVRALVYDTGRQDYFELRVVNIMANGVYLAMATDNFKEVSQPALRIEGLRKINDGGFLSYRLGSGSRLLEIQSSDFHSAPWTFGPTYQSMLNRASRLVPRIDSLDVVGDPRRELYDLIEISDAPGFLPSVIAQIAGRKSIWSAASGYRQELSVRALTLPGDWLLGITGFSELGETTILS